MDSQKPLLDYALPIRDGPPNASSALMALLFLVAGALTVGSIFVVFIGANDEPYFGPIRKSDALVQVGLACVLITLWMMWCVSVVLLARQRYIPPFVVFCVIWDFIPVFFLAYGVDGYLSDIIQSRGWASPSPAAPASLPSTP